MAADYLKCGLKQAGRRVEQDQFGVLLQIEELRPDHAEDREHVEPNLRDDEQDVVQLHVLVPVILQLAHLEDGNQRSRRGDAVDEQLHDVSLQFKSLDQDLVLKIRRVT